MTDKTPGHIDPDREAWQRFKDLPRDQPINMLNLVRLKPLATYPEGHAQHGKGLTGRQAYALYGRASAPVFRRLGGTQIWAGRPQVMLIGPQTEQWDIAFIARYPGGAAFLAMVTDPEYKLAVVHRTAAAVDTRLLRCDPIEELGEGFGE